MASRRKSRELALQMLFQWDFSKEVYARVRDSFWTLHQEAGDEVREFSDWLVQGAIENVEKIDVLLASHAEHWRLARMAMVDRNILRIATFELLHEVGTPRAVIINEALEVARKFSTPESILFINGILDSIRKGQENQDPSSSEPVEAPLEPNRF
ncbi:MAG: transcription antitermination factor NusB [Terriglobia bacterium]